MAAFEARLRTGHPAPADDHGSRSLHSAIPQPLAETAEHRIFGSGPPKQPLTPTLEYDVGNGEQHRQMTEHVPAKPSHPNSSTVLR